MLQRGRQVGSANHEWLVAHGVRPVTYGEELADRLRAAGLNAFTVTQGGGDVQVAIELGVALDQINTIADFALP
jgi:hypothetical protein